MATVALATGLTSLVTTVAAYSAQEEIDRARAPRMLHAYPDERPVGHWYESGNDITGYAQHTVVLLAPLDAEAAPPPGLPRWPQPGEAFLSPALLSAGESVGIRHRYGDFAGVIARPGLTNPLERLAYVRPAEGAASFEPADRVSGFGVAGDVPYRSFGDAAVAYDSGTLVSALAGFVLLPIAVLIVIACRVDADARDRRNRVLETLGGAWRHRALVNLGEAGGAVSIGAVAGVAPACVGLLWDVTVPVVGYPLTAAGLRAAWWMYLLVPGVSVLVVLASVVLLHRSRKVGPLRTPERPSRRWMVCLPLGVLIAMPSDLTPFAADLRVSLGQYVLGLSLVLVALPSLIAAAMALLGRLLAQAAERAGRAGVLVAGQWTRAHPGVTARTVAAAVVSLVLVTQVHLWTSRTSGEAEAAAATLQRIGTSINLVRTGPLTEQDLRDFREALPDQHVLMLLQRPDPRQPTELRGDCSALDALGQPCRSGLSDLAVVEGTQAVELQRWTGGRAGLLVRRAPLTDYAVASRAEDSEVQWSLLTVADPDNDAASAQVNRAAYAYLGMGPVITGLGGDALAGMLQYESYGRWIALLGGTGLVVLLGASVISSLNEFRAFSARLAPVGVLSGGRGFLRETSWWYLAPPLLLAAPFSVAAAWYMSEPVTRGTGTSMSPYLASVGALSCVLLAALTAAFGSRNASVTATRWRPGID
ncbi:hypothetical protein [Streptomyces sp. GSL17-111]|uniref:hypothetical protein n=1 Tax=Streptomyces sp. GSL17-111 TaxID=3121596 RepID=UPI0030F3ACEB